MKSVTLTLSHDDIANLYFAQKKRVENISQGTIRAVLGKEAFQEANTELLNKLLVALGESLDKA